VKTTLKTTIIFVLRIVVTILIAILIFATIASLAVENYLFVALGVLQIIILSACLYHSTRKP